MTKNFKNFIISSLGLLLIASCSKSEQEQPSTNLGDLKPVKYDVVADKEISSTRTGNIVFNPATNSNQFEYLTNIEKQTTLTPLSVVSISNLDVIYPGSILRGSSFLESTYDPLVLSNPFKSVTISGTLRGVNLDVTSSTLPKLSSVRNVINSLMNNNKGQFSTNAVPSVFEYESVDIINDKSLTASLDVHSSVNVLKGLVSANLNYSLNGLTTTTKKYTMVKMRQWLYNFAIDPVYYGDWIDGPIKISDCGSHEPVYISSVDYGRVAFLLIESNLSREFLEVMVSTSAKIGITGVVDGTTEANYKATFNQLISENKIKFMTVGGPAILGQQITDFNTFKTFVQSPSTADLVFSSVPISYKVRRLKDNTQVEVKDIYTTQIKELKAN